MTWDEIMAALRASGALAELDALERCAHERTIVRLGEDAWPRTSAPAVRAELAATVTRYLGSPLLDALDAVAIMASAKGTSGYPPEPFAAVLWAAAKALRARRTGFVMPHEMDPDDLADLRHEVGDD